MLNNLTKLLEDGQDVDGLWLDFEKMFDKIKHQKLMALLDAHWIKKEGRVFKWIEEWLMNKLQQVVMLGKKSITKDVLASVIQGSVLGPRLAKIFGNQPTMTPR